MGNLLMNYYTCNCGKSELWESGMFIFACQGCDECNSQYGHPDNTNILDREPHDFSLPVYDRRTGELRGYECSKCYELKKV